MFHIRTTKTSSGATAVQVVRYKNRKKIIAVHIDSAHNKKDLSSLKDLASDWIKKTTKQQELFPVSNDTRPNLIPLDKCKHLEIYYSFIYSVLSKISFTFKFHLLQKPLLSDLALMRVIEPASKSRSLELLEEYFGIKHQRRNFYRQLPEFLKLKNQIESNVLRIAKKHFNFDFSWVFYDVTTLYFESFGEDELRKLGLSKDNKANQPQILIGLVVNADGFPIAYEVFGGNKLEGHTLIPIITAFKNRHKIECLTVVADAAMISFKNIEELNKNGLKYIVGARMGNLSDELFYSINSELKREDGATVRLKTKYGGLVCGFSAKR